jgi:ubiquinone/menaquinone biosynthesis C-methylase UbiE
VQQFNFTDADWIAHIKSFDLPGLSDWMLSQAQRGVAYHSARVQRLALSGNRVLDAGCGAGTWALALARVFSEVEALDTDPKKIDVLNVLAKHFDGRIRTTVGSTEALPFPDRSFDTVFCSGVIFLTDYKKTMAEFVRVLEPNGTLFLCYNGEAWWRFLLFERGRNEPDCVIYGSNGRTSLWLRLLDELSLEHRIPDAMRKSFRQQLDASQAEEAIEKYNSASAEARLDFGSKAVAAVRALFATVSASPRDATRLERAIGCLDDVTLHGTSSDREIIAKDLISRICRARSDYALPYNTHSHDPQDMGQVLADFGFSSINSAPDGCLCIDHSAPSAPPFYQPRQGVFETLCRAPGAISREISTR